ncbi:hypothetical protein IFR05_014984 [Cadophora sp. M221]|nr:hypothetical protein IFR05_014984 [Cadophora sp. M221]
MSLVKHGEELPTEDGQSRLIEDRQSRAIEDRQPRLIEDRQFRDTEDRRSRATEDRRSRATGYGDDLVAEDFQKLLIEDGPNPRIGDGKTLALLIEEKSLKQGLSLIPDEIMRIHVDFAVAAALTYPRASEEIKTIIGWLLAYDKILLRGDLKKTVTALSHAFHQMLLKSESNAPKANPNAQIEADKITIKSQKQQINMGLSDIHALKEQIQTLRQEKKNAEKLVKHYKELAVTTK